MLFDQPDEEHVLIWQRGPEHPKLPGPPFYQEKNREGEGATFDIQVIF